MPDLNPKTVADALAKATPGPWREGSRDERSGRVWIGGSNEHGGFVLPYLAVTLNWPENFAANATLIAMAPDLARAWLAAQAELALARAYQEAERRRDRAADAYAEALATHDAKGIEEAHKAYRAASEAQEEAWDAWQAVSGEAGHG